MKQKIYILGLAITGILFTGTFFKVNHWPGAGYLITTGILTLVFIFLPVALRNHYKTEGNKQNKLLYIITWLTCFVIFIGMLFKIQHWPGAGYALIIGLPFPYIVFLPVFLVVTSKNKSFNIYNTVYILFLLAVFSAVSALLALNVSKEMTVDSLKISGNYNKLERMLEEIPVQDQQSPVNLKIDEVIKIANNYQDMILENQGMTQEQWGINPENLMYPESANIPMVVLAESGESSPGDRLQTALKELLALMEQCKGYEAAAKALPAILGVAEKIGMEPDWTVRHVAGASLSWALIYLDGLETNLLMIKASNY